MSERFAGETQKADDLSEDLIWFYPDQDLDQDGMRAPITRLIELDDVKVTAACGDDGEIITLTIDGAWRNVQALRQAWLDKRPKPRK